MDIDPPLRTSKSVPSRVGSPGPLPPATAPAVVRITEEEGGVTKSRHSPAPPPPTATQRKLLKMARGCSPRNKSASNTPGAREHSEERGAAKPNPTGDQENGTTPGPSGLVEIRDGADRQARLAQAGLVVFEGRATHYIPDSAGTGLTHKEWRQGPPGTWKCPGPRCADLAPFKDEWEAIDHHNNQHAAVAPRFVCTACNAAILQYHEA